MIQIGDFVRIDGREVGPVTNVGEEWIDVETPAGTVSVDPADQNLSVVDDAEYQNAFDEWRIRVAIASIEEGIANYRNSLRDLSQSLTYNEKFRYSSYETLRQRVSATFGKQQETTSSKFNGINQRFLEHKASIIFGPKRLK